jgi:hypothetical protein
MPADSRIALLLAEMEKTQSVLARIDAFYREQRRRLDEDAARTTEQAIVLADVLVSYYTCLETLFLRVSQYFENRLDREKWHRELLERMTLEIPGVRERMLSIETGDLLAELLRFRHFKRYYFELHYDWDRLEFVRKKYDQARPLLAADLARFESFLRRLNASD